VIDCDREPVPWRNAIWPPSGGVVVPEVKALLLVVTPLEPVYVHEAPDGLYW